MPTSCRCTAINSPILSQFVSPKQIVQYCGACGICGGDWIYNCFDTYGIYVIVLWLQHQYRHSPGEESYNIKQMLYEIYCGRDLHILIVDVTDTENNIGQYKGHTVYT